MALAFPIGPSPTACDCRASPQRPGQCLGRWGWLPLWSSLLGHLNKVPRNGAQTAGSYRLTVPEVRSSMSEWLAGMVSSEASPWLVDGCLHRVLSWPILCVYMLLVFLPFVKRTTVKWDRTHCILTCLFKDPISK